MGLTESNSKHFDTQQKYKLIRRYTSDCYGDLTVIQDKQTQQTYAMKQFITQNQFVVNLIQSRKNLRQRSLVIMEDYCFSGDQSICSNIRKLQIIFQYYPTTLDEEIRNRAEKNQIFGDFQILQIFNDSVECLQYLQQMNFLHLIGGMKMLLYDTQSKSIKIMQNQQLLIHSQRGKKKQLNIIGILGSKKILPLHPLNQPKDVCDVCLTAEKVAHQNLFTLGLICIGLCWLKQPLELGIFGKGGYIFQKIQKRIRQIKNKYPYVHRILSFFMSKNQQIDRKTYKQLLNEISTQKRSFYKQNEKNQRLIDIQPIQKIGQKKTKKLSYLRQMRLSNNDIPNQF